MPDDSPTPDWSPKAVLNRLAAESGPKAPVSVQLFLGEQVAADDIFEFVGKAAHQTATNLGISPEKVHLGKAFKLARSIGITAPLPLVSALMARDEFIDILPSDPGDIMIRPVDRNR
jgi:hypothetical protein